MAAWRRRQVSPRRRTFRAPVQTVPGGFIRRCGKAPAGIPQGRGWKRSQQHLHAYYEIVSGKKIYITNPKGQSGGIWDDEKDAVPAYPTDAQVATEALVGVSHFGYDASGSYIVATPHGRSSQGFGVQWCAYHSETYDAGKLVSYTNLPYMPDAVANCGADAIKAPKDESRTDEGATIVEGVEYGESVTDPNPGTGWYDFQYGEIGDLCSGLHNDRFGKKRYTMKAMFSNNTSGGSCVQKY
jgi:hypothetical protein